MNKALKTIIAIMGGIDTFVYIFTPFLLVLIFNKFFNIIGWRVVAFWAVGLISILFRAIKVGLFKFNNE
ncbi:MAG: hypothetical protein ACLFPS_05805 [Clostridia bacterium]